MTKLTLVAHPSVTIAHCRENGKLLMAVYDAGYSQVSYRFSANNIGGNPDFQKHPNDTSPLNVFFREAGEEYDPNHPEKTNFGETVLWAPPRNIFLVRKALLENTKPIQDFLVTAVKLIDDPTTNAYSAIYSGFYTQVPLVTMDIVETNLRRCRRLCTEGLTGVFTIDELSHDRVKGRLSTAHATAPMINYLFGSNIPHPDELSATPIGQVRPTFQDYLADFNYAERIAKATGVVQ